DTSHDLIVRYELGGKQIESRTGGRGGEFEVVVEAADKIPLDGGKTGHGFVVTTKQGTSRVVSNIHVTEENGTFATPCNAEFETKDGLLTFADFTIIDGKKLPVFLRLEQKKK